MPWMLKNRETDDAIPLKRLAVTGAVDGLTLRWTLSQTFKNTQSQAIEAIYTFPVAWASVVTEFAAVIEGERLVAKAFLKTEAEARYENAREAGDAPMMLETSTDGVATVTLGNLKPGDEVTLEISLFTVLLPQNGTVRATIPLCLADRYSADGRQGALQPYEHVTSDLAADYPATARFTVKGLLADCTVTVPSHPAAVSRKDGVLTITVSRAAADRNLVLGFDDVPDANGAWTAKEPSASCLWAAMLVLTPPRRDVRHPLQVDLLIDCSGSMAGVGIAKVREALASLTDVLTEEDCVTLTRFGSAPERTISAPHAFTKAFQRRSYLPVVDRIDANLGGTELNEALRVTARDIPADAAPDRRRFILLITDGEVWDTEPVLKAVKGAAPVFCIGVGDNSVETVLQQIAQATGGLCRLVTHAEDMTDVISNLIGAARCDAAHLPEQSPLLQALRREAVLWHSPVDAVLHAGCAAKILLRLSAAPETFLSDKEVQALTGAGWQTANDARALAQAAAFAQCASCTEVDADLEMTEAEKLAQEYGLLTPGTNLLLVKERDSSEKRVAEAIVNVPQMAPLGLASAPLFEPMLCSHNGPDYFSCCMDDDRLSCDGACDLKSLSNEKKECLGLVDSWLERFTALDEAGRAAFWREAFADLSLPLTQCVDDFVSDCLPLLTADDRQAIMPALLVLTFLATESDLTPEECERRQNFLEAAQTEACRLISLHYPHKPKLEFLATALRMQLE